MAVVENFEAKHLRKKEKNRKKNERKREVSFKAYFSFLR